MAHFFFDLSTVSRARGRSVVQAAAYRSGERLADARRGRVFDYRARTDVLASNLLAAEGADLSGLSREAFWNAVEAREGRQNACVAEEILLTLPAELELQSWIALADRFARHALTSRGFVVDRSIHLSPEGPRHPHVHLLYSPRRVAREGSDGSCSFALKDQGLRSFGNLMRMRADWADLTNSELAGAGLDRRVDHRSYRARGVPLRPMKRLPGKTARRYREVGYAASDPERAELNGDLVSADPALALRGLLESQSAFTEPDLKAFLKRFSAPGAQRSFALSAVKSSDALVRLGEGDDGRLWFTSREALERQTALEELGSARANGRGGARLALVRGCEEDLGSILSAPPGTGSRGWLVSAAAPDDAEALGRRFSMTSASLSSLPYALRNVPLEDRPNLLISGADRPGPRALSDLLRHELPEGALLVLHVDPRRAVSGAAGAAFRSLEERIGSLRLQNGELRLQPPSPVAYESPERRFARHLDLGITHDVGSGISALQAARRRDHLSLARSRAPGVAAAYVDVVRNLAAAGEAQFLSAGAERLGRAHLRLRAVLGERAAGERLPESFSALNESAPHIEARLKAMIEGDKDLERAR